MVSRGYTTVCAKHPQRETIPKIFKTELKVES